MQSPIELAAAPTFIRNIVSVPRQLKQLNVPKGFVEDNPEIFRNCTSVVLQVPGGKEYKVDVEKNSGSFVFRGGWKDFAKHYDLDCGYFLVFYYCGSSRFQVGIADTSNCEIEYTPYHCQCVPYSEEEEEDEEEDVEKGREIVSLALDKAEMHHCAHPNFTVLMSSSYLASEYRMWVPISHGKRYLKSGNSKARLAVESEEGGGITKFKVKVKNGPKCVRFGAGWKEFVKANHLDANDVCKFELVDRQTQTYLVHIFRG